jgi:pimeloyl-ACP methyl ester carboxylesterase
VNGPIVLVGHSYGGAVITNAAVGNTNVKALVYIAAYIPDQGQSLGQLAPASGGSGLVSPGVPGVTPTLVVRPCPATLCAAGFDAYIDPADFRALFAADLEPERTAVMAVEQRPLSVSALFDQSGPPAWKQFAPSRWCQTRITRSAPSMSSTWRRMQAHGSYG